MVLIHALVVGMILIGILTYPLLRQSRRLAQRPYWRRSSSTSSNPLYQNPRLVIAILFYLLTSVIVFFVIAPICKNVTGENPFMW
jgi:ABC-type Fe3+ transport system permease subunit